ncbi:MAG: 2-succinyl-6-hydroxy-2,4-cyclohexadiene-1-carboxylate synthase [Ktedonobacterales bacterium]
MTNTTVAASRRLLEVNGVRLNAELREPSGPPVRTLTLLHGFTGSAAGWGAHLDTFAAAGLRVIALDMLGHGASDAPDDASRYAVEQCGDDILAALGQLGVGAGRSALLGYSMGGRIALYTALSGYFHALILESASPGLASKEERAMRRASDEALAHRIERDGISSFVEEWEGLPLFASQQSLPAERRAALRAQRMRNRALGLANSLRGVGTGAQPSLWDALPRLTMPTLLIAGALDVKYMAIARQMAERLPSAQLAIVPNAGHATHFEQPAAFDEAVTAFCLEKMYAT